MASILAFILLACAFNLPTRDFSIPTRANNLVTRAISVLTRGFQLVTRGLGLVTCRFELVTRALLFHGVSWVDSNDKQNQSIAIGWNLTFGKVTKQTLRAFPWQEHPTSIFLIPIGRLRAVKVHIRTRNYCRMKSFAKFLVSSRLTRDSWSESYPNREFFLVHIFQYANWIQENTDQKKLET